jgi:hypothetical protein
LLGHGCLRSDREAEELHHPENVAAQEDRELYRKFKCYFPMTTVTGVPPFHSTETHA